MMDDLFEELASLAASERRPFPYEACRRAQAGNEQYASLIPDLDAYSSAIAGYRSWGRRILSWSDDRIAALRRDLTPSFIDRYPVYAQLLTESVGAELVVAMQPIERTRVVLLEIIGELQRERGAR